MCVVIGAEHCVRYRAQFVTVYSVKKITFFIKNIKTSKKLLLKIENLNKKSKYCLNKKLLLVAFQINHFS